MTELDREAPLVKHRAVTATTVADELVMLDLQRDAYYGLNAVAVAIWEQLDRPTAPAEIETILLRRFDVEPERCREECDAFLKQLIAADLIAPATT